MMPIARIAFSCAALALLMTAVHSAGLQPRTTPGEDGRIFVPCNYTLEPGSSCWDCDTVLICTRIGGILAPCWWPGSRHCADGVCGPEPSPECAPKPTGPTPEPTESTPEPTGTTPEPTGTTPEPTGTTPEPTGTTPEPTSEATSEAIESTPGPTTTG